MICEQDSLGQEGDINRACSVFGLDTVNYRSFPNNGPVPVTVQQETASASDLLISNAAEATGPMPHKGSTTLQRKAVDFSLTKCVHPTLSPGKVPAADHTASLPAPIAFQLQFQALPAPLQQQAVPHPQARDMQPALIPAMEAASTTAADPAISTIEAEQEEAFGKAFAAAYIAAFGPLQR